MLDTTTDSAAAEQHAKQEDVEYVDYCDEEWQGRANLDSLQAFRIEVKEMDDDDVL